MIITSDFACQDLVELVTDYLDGALAPDRRAEFDAHIADCDYCAEYLDQIRGTIVLTGSLAEDDLSPAARDTLLDAFHDWKIRRSPN